MRIFNLGLGTFLILFFGILYILILSLFIDKFFQERLRRRSITNQSYNHHHHQQQQPQPYYPHHSYTISTAAEEALAREEYYNAQSLSFCGYYLIPISTVLYGMLLLCLFTLEQEQEEGEDIIMNEIEKLNDTDSLFYLRIGFGFVMGSSCILGLCILCALHIMQNVVITTPQVE